MPVIQAVLDGRAGGPGWLAASNAVLGSPTGDSGWPQIFPMLFVTALRQSIQARTAPLYFQTDKKPCSDLAAAHSIGLESEVWKVTDASGAAEGLTNRYFDQQKSLM